MGKGMFQNMGLFRMKTKLVFPKGYFAFLDRGQIRPSGYNKERLIKKKL